MTPEENVEVVEETTPDVPTEDKQQVADALSTAQASLETGDTLEVIDQTIAELEAIKSELVGGQEDSPLGGLGGGDFNLPEPEEA